MATSPLTQAEILSLSRMTALIVSSSRDARRVRHLIIFVSNSQCWCRLDVRGINFRTSVLLACSLLFVIEFPAYVQRVCSSQRIIVIHLGLASLSECTRLYCLVENNNVFIRSFGDAKTKQQRRRLEKSAERFGEVLLGQEEIFGVDIEIVRIAPL